MDRLRYQKEWADYRTGLICAVMANTWRGSKQKVFKPQDFMPQRSEPQTVEQMMAVVRMLHAAYGGELVIDGHR